MNAANSLDTLFATLYDTLSGPAGPRDWGRIRPLYYPGAIMTRVGVDDEGLPIARLMTFDEYVAATAPFLESKDFFEIEIERVVERYGNVAHVRSTYESRWAPEAEPFMSGINSVQLFHDGARWWIMSVIWDNGKFGRQLAEGTL